jgi:acetyl esterase
MTVTSRRVRLAYGLLARIPGANIAGMTPEQIVAANARLMGRNRLSATVLGGLAPGVRYADRTFPGPAGEVPIRVYTPVGEPKARPVVLHIHGGGFCLGNLDMDIWMCSHLAAGADAVVVSVDYRLAPEHPFPAAVDDCLAAVAWVHAHAAELGADPDDLAVMGESAGGNLSAVMCLLARDAGGPRIRRQILIYPAVDAVFWADPANRVVDQPFLTRAHIDAFLGHYVGARPEVVSDPRLSPLHATDLSGLPPAYILTGTCDVLEPEGLRYRDALRAAGVPVQLCRYTGMPHGFLNMPGLCPPARSAMDHIVAFQTHTD